MASLAATAKDILPIPDNFEIVTNPEKQETSASLADEPTMSHALAVADHDEKGHVQQVQEEGIQDLGWHEDDENVPNPLVGGVPNEELWLLLRRFNKVLQLTCFGYVISLLTISSKYTMFARCVDRCPGTWI